MDKIIAVLELIEDGPRTWDEIEAYCLKIGFDPEHASQVLKNKDDPLVVESSAGYRPTLKGHQMVDEARRGVSQATAEGVSVKNSSNVTIIAGNENKVTQRHEQAREVSLNPYTPNQYALMGIGRWIMRRIYGRLDHSLMPYTLAVSLLTLLTGVPLFASVIPNLNYGSLPSYLYTPDIFAFALVLILGWGVTLTGHETECPKCHRRFSYTLRSKVLVGRANLPESDVRNYRSTYSCDACGFKRENVKEIEEIQRT